MDVGKLNKIITLLENTQRIGDAQQFIQVLKPCLRQQAKNSFVKVGFDKSDCQGVVFIKFVKKPHTEVTSSTSIEDADLKFIIGIEGFNPEGTVTEDTYNEYRVSMYQYENKNGANIKQLKEKTFTGLHSAKSYIESYFKNNSKVLYKEEGEGGAIGGEASIGTTTADIATVAPKLGMPMLLPPTPNQKSSTFKNPYSIKKKKNKDNDG